jgi:hypothetical protein
MDKIKSGIVYGRSVTYKVEEPCLDSITLYLLFASPVAADDGLISPKHVAHPSERE